MHHLTRRSTLPRSRFYRVSFTQLNETIVTVSCWTRATVDPFNGSAPVLTCNIVALNMKIPNALTCRGDTHRLSRLSKPILFPFFSLCLFLSLFFPPVAPLAEFSARSYSSDVSLCYPLWNIDALFNAFEMRAAEITPGYRGKVFRLDYRFLVQVRERSRVFN